MHPVLAGRRPLVAYLATWSPAAALLAAVLALSGSLSWSEAALLAIPLALLYAFVGLGAYWVCQAAPLHLAGLPRVLATQLAAAAFSGAAWALAARALATGYERVGVALGLDPALAERTERAAPLVFGMGVLLFLLAAAAHYLLAAVEASRRAETEALRLAVLSREAELRALRAQLHPHFFFNSLNSISALVGTKPDEARRVCQLLAELLRKSLAAGNRESVPLAEEVALAKSYLSVEQVRFGERLGVETRVDPAAEGWRVPALVLQPIVENAVTHGVSARLEGGTVRIAAAIENGRLLLTVENPRDPEASPRPGSGLGLDNVRRRLEAVYGRDAEVQVTKGPDRFRVELRLPASPTGVAGPV